VTALGTYLLRLTAAAMVTALAAAVTPKGNGRRATAFVGGLVLLIAAVSPLAKLDTADLAKAISKLELQSDAAATGVTVTNREIVAVLITRRTEAYILDKATDLGAAVTASVETDADGDWPYPTAVTVTGDWTDDQRTQLSDWIAAELAIPAERQEWIGP
jgi:hypothetical protein